MTLPAIIGAQAFDQAFWLKAANQTVRSYCGWHVAPIITESITLDGNGSKTLLLPSKRVTDVVSVLNDGIDVTATVRKSEKGMLELTRGCWSDELGAIEVTFTHGYEAADDVAGVIAALVSRAASSPAGIAAQAVGPANVKYATGPGGVPLSIPLMAGEMLTLDAYRI
ncbi:hypothetical protein E3T43_07260 [Cryobacterium sp. Hh7]|uniref:hypothetical protein n=1 Tax=Cryobacterium sp. Hh7 TaxID=1259159 RepID=UPI00106D1295|nr:hypothetical protein [Cryobacterium sp. Hh7]TFD58037.1 hypothetical protein E3T43_07260 [Cryobacterium sp. Hh7]